MRFGNETLRTHEFGDAKPIETLLAPALRFRTMWGLKGFDKAKKANASEREEAKDMGIWSHGSSLSDMAKVLLDWFQSETNFDA